jgi:hypothetical protein
MSITQRTERITPSKAVEWLKLTGPNRPIQTRRANIYAQAMLRDEWLPNGETIKFDVKEKLRDGQHRLHGIIAANKAIDMLVVRGIPEAAFDTIDTGGRRTVGDVFKVHDVDNYNAVACAIAWMHRFNEGRPRDFTSPTHPQAVALLRENPGILESGSYICRFKGRHFPHGLAIYLHYVCSRLDKRLADEFFAKMYDGDGLLKTGPLSGLYLLRRRLTEESNGAGKPSRAGLAAMAIKAWNAAREGKTVKVMRWTSEHESGEHFPAPK